MLQRVVFVVVLQQARQGVEDGGNPDDVVSHQGITVDNIYQQLFLLPRQLFLEVVRPQSQRVQRALDVVEVDIPSAGDFPREPVEEHVDHLPEPSILEDRVVDVLVDLSERLEVLHREEQVEHQLLRGGPRSVGIGQDVLFELLQRGGGVLLLDEVGGRLLDLLLLGGGLRGGGEGTDQQGRESKWLERKLGVKVSQFLSAPTEMVLRKLARQLQGCQFAEFVAGF